MSDVGELFVKIRPDSAGFKAEAEGPVAAAGRDLSKVFLAAFAVGGIAKTIESMVHAATEHQAAFAVLDQTVKDAGASNEVYGKSLERLLEQEARLKGFSDEDLASAFQRLISVTHDSGRAWEDLGKAEDLARFRHIELAQAALLLSKAEQGKYQSLQRVGIVVPQVTTAEDALTLAHARLLASGYKLTQSEKERYAAALAGAKATDAQKTSAEALSLVQQRTGGTAKAFAETASGQFARLQQDFHQFEVAIGTPLLGGLATAAESLGKFFTHLTDSGEAAQVVSAAAHDIGDVLHEVGVVAETVGPPLLVVAKAAETVASTIGAPAILTGIAAYKAVGVAVGIAGAAESFYSRALLANQGITLEATAANQALAASYTEVGLASALTASERGIGSLVGGLRALAAGAASPPVIAIGVAALAAGIVYLVRQEDAWDRANKSLRTSTDHLVDSINAEHEAVGRLGQSAARRDREDQTRKETEAIVGLASAAERSALPALNNLNRGVETTWSQAQKAAVRQQILNQEIESFAHSLGETQNRLGKSDPLLSHNIDLVGQLTKALHGIPPEIDIRLLLNNQDPSATVNEVLTGAALLKRAFAELADALTPPARAVIPAHIGGTYTSPAVRAANEAIKALRAGIEQDKADLTQLDIDMADAITQGTQNIANAVQQAKGNLNSIGQSLASTIGQFIDKPLNDEAQRLSDAQDRIALTFDKLSATLTEQGAKLSREQAQLSLASAKKSLHDLSTSIILPGGHALSADPEKGLAQLERLQKTTKSPGLDTYILEYRSQLLTVKQGELGLKTSALDARRTAQETQIGLAGDALKIHQDAAAHTKERVIRQIADLTDLLNKGVISEPVFDRKLNTILKKSHLTFIAAAKADGIAFADTFAAQLTGLGLQEAAIKAGPHQPGTGLIPSIVRPLDTVNQTQKQIAGIAKEQRQKQLDESKKHTALLKKIAGERAATVFFASSVEKNPGQETKRAAALTGVSG